MYCVQCEDQAFRCDLKKKIFSEGFFKLTAFCLQLSVLLKEALQGRCFYVSFANFYRTPALPNIAEEKQLLPAIKEVFLEFFYKIHRKTPVPESLFNKVAGLRSAIY